ncbi:helix-turn-helix domain-containing protein [Fodinicola acaciae]|uniref:helix-turn-helix domain-containing protein n=1 Tax=Fodinicola acaciae TaxID=2681555 RepID=UPI001FE4AF05|nr:helix-turn-helix domain-containing protein [Fodinicola acaciae]
MNGDLRGHKKMQAYSQMLTVDEAAERMGMSVRHVRRLVSERSIPFYKVGRSVRIASSDVDAYLRALRVETLNARRGVA